MSKVTLIGRIAIDFNPTDYYNTLDKNTNFNMYLGGSPANIAIALSRLDIDVNFYAKVSNDQFGTYVKNYFSENNISTKGIVDAKEGENLGLTFTEMKSESESSILMYRDGVADLNLHPSEIDENLVKDSDYLVISGTALAKSPSREACLLALEYAKRNNVKIVFDIDYRAYSWANEEEISIYYSLVAREANIVIGSREEINLTEKYYLPNNEDDLKSANYLFEQGCEIVIIKHGKKGSNVYTKDHTYLVKPHTIKALKGFGGGDAYLGAFLASYLKSGDLKQALFYATVHAAILISSHSCSQDMKSFAEIDSYIKEHNIDIDKLIEEL